MSVFPSVRAEPSPASDQAERLTFFLLKRVSRAIREFDMIRPGDKVAVALSGGKDSISLLHLLTARLRTVSEPYHLSAIHVRGDTQGALPVHQALTIWLEQRHPHLPFRVVEPPLSKAEPLPMTCRRCTQLRRKALFTAAATLGCNVIAFAHHADDAAQTSLLNVLYGGRLRTMAPHAAYFGGQYRLVRPLLHVPENELARLARAIEAPDPPPACPRSTTSRRATVAAMLKLLGRDYPVQVRRVLVNAGLLDFAAGSPSAQRAHGDDL